MTFRVFQYRLPAPPELADLNGWLASHRAVAVKHYVVPGADGGMLVFVVETTGNSDAAATGGGSPSRADKTDYRDVLNGEDFAIFSQLRDERKRIATGEGVPVYTVLSNAQLAAMVQNRVVTAEAMGEIEGVGKARVEKYAGRMLAVMALHFSGGGKESP